MFRLLIQVLQIVSQYTGYASGCSYTGELVCYIIIRSLNVCDALKDRYCCTTSGPAIDSAVPDFAVVFGECCL